MNTVFPEGVCLNTLIDPLGRRSVSCLYKGKTVPVAKITGKMAKHVAGYSLIVRDLTDALAWIHESEKITRSISSVQTKWAVLSNDPVAVTARGLFVGALVFYGKCFSEARGRGTRMKESDIHQTFVAAHRYFIDHRDSYAAHSGDSFIETAATYAMIHPNPKKAKAVFTQTLITKPTLMNACEADGVRFDQLIEHVLEIAEKKKAALFDRLRENVGNYRFEELASSIRRGASIAI